MIEDKKENRSKIITIVETPLGFFVLIVLVIESFFGIIVFKSSEGIERAYILFAMFILIFLLAGVVAFLAYYRTEALIGVNSPKTKRSSNIIPNNTQVTLPNSLLEYLYRRIIFKKHGKV